MGSVFSNVGLDEDNILVGNCITCKSNGVSLEEHVCIKK